MVKGEEKKGVKGRCAFYQVFLAESKGYSSIKQQTLQTRDF